MRRLRGFARASHAPPTMAVTAVIVAFAWLLGWRDWPLAGVGTAVLIGQLSVGWSNDAFDSGLDTRAGRSSKPTVAGDVGPRALWIGATIALALSAVLSWTVAGALGGSFHVFALAVAWLYNVKLSRTAWSWLPYALAFGSLPLFLTYGLNGEPPPGWMVPAFALTAVSAHLANALPDLERDRTAGIGGAAVRLGAHRTVVLGWVLLALGTTIVAIALARATLAVAIVMVVAYVSIALCTRLTRRPSPFYALLSIVVVDVAAIVIATQRL